MENIATTCQPVVYLGFFLTLIMNEPSASVKPVINKGLRVKDGFVLIEEK
jgi:hypothetical protein